MLLIQRYARSIETVRNSFFIGIVATLPVIGFWLGHRYFTGSFAYTYDPVPSYYNNNDEYVFHAHRIYDALAFFVVAFIVAIFAIDDNHYGRKIIKAIMPNATDMEGAGAVVFLPILVGMFATILGTLLVGYSNIVPLVMLIVTLAYLPAIKSIGYVYVSMIDDNTKLSKLVKFDKKKVTSKESEANKQRQDKLLEPQRSKAAGLYSLLLTSTEPNGIASYVREQVYLMNQKQLDRLPDPDKFAFELSLLQTSQGVQGYELNIFGRNQENIDLYLPQEEDITLV